MGKVYPEIDGRLRDFIAAQPLFFVATAPSGVRLHGRGSSVAVTEEAFADRLAEFPAPPDVHAVRAVITVEVERVSDSCGYAVPLMDFRAERDLLLTSHSRRSADDLVVYRATKNAASIDGLPVF
ncbi:hypothetical protein [Micromonospora sp. NPDC050276]|uniref:hypothetical protein n=1 Tax=Micromonospora sp. NPDC050276 TaxID=3364278 RepID=UPI0037985B86